MIGVDGPALGSNRGECGQSGRPRMPLLAAMAPIREEPPVGFEPTTFAMHDGGRAAI